MIAADVKLTRAQRTKLLRFAGLFMHNHPGVERFEVADHVFGYMLEHEVEFGLGDHEAVDISDYAYGVASFLVRETV